jgi:hypothetical protein
MNEIKHRAIAVVMASCLLGAVVFAATAQAELVTPHPVSPPVIAPHVVTPPSAPVEEAPVPEAPLPATTMPSDSIAPASSEPAPDAPSTSAPSDAGPTPPAPAQSSSRPAIEPVGLIGILLCPVYQVFRENRYKSALSLYVFSKQASAGTINGFDSTQDERSGTFASTFPDVVQSVSDANQSAIPYRNCFNTREP